MTPRSVLRVRHVHFIGVVTHDAERSNWLGGWCRVYGRGIDERDAKRVRSHVASSMDFNNGFHFDDDDDINGDTNGDLGQDIRS